MAETKQVERPGWVERPEPIRAEEGEFASYELRLTSDHWVTVHAGPRIRVVQSPMGINVSRPSGYASVEEAMKHAEFLYRESLSNVLTTAEARAADMRQALADFPTSPSSSSSEEVNH